MAADASHDPYAPWREPAFARYMSGKTCALIGQAMVVTAIGWELYERTHARITLDMFAVLFGGVGTLAVVGIAASRWPTLRRLGPIETPPEPGSARPA